jgi:broad specificity phosphatase PhoE
MGLISTLSSGLLTACGRPVNGDYAPGTIVGPRSLTAVRHAQSVYNAFDIREIPDYPEFVELFDCESASATQADVLEGIFPSARLRELAIKIQREAESHPDSPLLLSDKDTPLSDFGHWQAEETGRHILDHAPKPDAVYVASYLRPWETWRGMSRACSHFRHLENTGRVYRDRRMREQNHGLRANFAGPRIYAVLNPDYLMLYKKETVAGYRHQNGESPYDVSKRVRSMLSTVVRRHGGESRTLRDLALDEVNRRSNLVGRAVERVFGRDNTPQNVLFVTHHRTILVLRSLLERWDDERFCLEDEWDNRPPNASITSYHGVPVDLANSGQAKLRLDFANRVLWRAEDYQAGAAS